MSEGDGWATGESWLSNDKGYFFNSPKTINQTLVIPGSPAFVVAAVKVNEKLAAVPSVDELYPVLHGRP